MRLRRRQDPIPSVCRHTPEAVVQPGDWDRLRHDILNKCPCCGMLVSHGTLIA